MNKPAAGTPWQPVMPPSGSVEQALDEVRGKIHPRSVSGRYARWRVGLVVVTQLVFYGLPWLQYGGRQAVLFDLGARKFYLFGLVLWPQDAIYLALLLVISALALFLFTAIAGRLFCGYACPQTVYTELFMWIERRVEGDRLARIRLDEAPWDARKWRLKITKHALWLALAWWTGSTFIGYFAPIRELGGQLFAGQLGGWQWFWMLFYGFATWGNAGFMRESVCKYMCPYARFQSVMVDPDTYVVTYDRLRGEPRGGRSRRLDHHGAGMGDCVDCSLCVQVCPTGIDIRDGLQYLCIGCGACIDACGAVMDKMRYPRGLIRYTSERAMQQGLSPGQTRKRLLRPRVLIYGGLLLLLCLGFAGSLALRSPLRLDVMRDRGVLGREVAGGEIENVYRLQFINTSDQPLTLRLTAQGLPQLRVLALPQAREVLSLPAASNTLVPVVIRGKGASPGPHSIVLRAEAIPAGPQVEEAATFYVPE
ncbi:cytochrome c oxidase accessory protein CcoG [Bordetella hinzii]|uniref:Cytochrome c oxidase accessory protein CcoG n=1 Tax=Bordetella hinzii TaxID=103855 RepID=A0AAN1RUF6_9BORD|nr:cytochrome c oxidase accessory protein CcoG [Bordetella hinzii]AKQ59266.1 quinol dehydrogenase membrane component [Bordetella hinzii]AZW15487.1 cytochrome c oxidase accessory protein CcoG [Bordetella hinzii]KCB50711.1 cytochrome c oxidase accessory protein CcoG [Bordetella hinzii 1277]MBZ0076711.1 cytochrome c oxidase accessory protein CcoG [Bordetella hinzii]MBZ0078998.1 cytochrome c oxidase accessory protein CcoG [Bordetella hinzii]